MIFLQFFQKKIRIILILWTGSRTKCVSVGVSSFDSASSTLPRRRPTSMRPLRQCSVGDDEQIVVSGFIYRQMLQDLTYFKTMLFKLKRLIQEVIIKFFSVIAEHLCFVDIRQNLSSLSFETWHCNLWIGKTWRNI